MNQSAVARQLRFELTPTLADQLARHSVDGEPASTAVDSGGRLAQALLLDAIKLGATDIHLEPQSDATRVRLRIDGSLLDTAVLTPEQGGRLLRHFKAMSGIDTADHFHAADARLTETVDNREVDLRLASLPSVAGEKLSIRLLDRARILHSLDQLGLTNDQKQAIEQWMADMSGMFLVAGPTGSGKTTTSYALLHALASHERSVVTIEDPVEYRIDGITQIQTNRRHNLTFPEGLRAMLRSDPDYMLVGEIRDDQTAHVALEASGSGRVLTSTIHAPDAIGTITALRNFGLADHQIASALRLVVSQRLVRVLCSWCRRPRDLEDTERRWLESVGLDPGIMPTFVADGCTQCRNLGYHGRTGVFEVWRLTDADYQAILRHDDERAIRAAVAARGVPTLLQNAWAKAQTGLTSLAEIRAFGNAAQPRTNANPNTNSRSGPRSAPSVSPSVVQVAAV